MFKLLPLRFLKLTLIETSVVAVTLALLAVSTAMYVAAKPKIDFILVAAPLASSIAIIVAEYLSGELKIDLTPLGSAPTAYTLYYATAVYLKQAWEPLTISYSILLGSTIAITALTIILLTRRQPKVII